MIDYLTIYRQFFKGSRKLHWERKVSPIRKSQRFATTEDFTDDIQESVKEYVTEEVKTVESTRPKYFVRRRRSKVTIKPLELSSINRYRQKTIESLEVSAP